MKDGIAALPLERYGPSRGFSRETSGASACVSTSISGTLRRPRSPRGSREEEDARSEEHTSELQSRVDLVCRLLLEKKKKTKLTTSRENTLQKATTIHD